MGGRGVGLCAKTTKRMDGEAAEEKERVTAILGGDWAGSGPADRRKEGGMGGWRVSGAPTSSARRAPEARGWGPRSGLREGRGDTGGCDAGTHHGSASGGVRLSGGRAGRVSHRLPPGAQSRRVWLQDSSHRGRGSARSLARWLAGSGAQAAGPRQGGPRRPPAPPRPARDPSRDAPSVASLASAPLAVRGQPAPPRTLREPPS